MKYLLFLSTCLLLLNTSCAPTLIKGLHKESRQVVKKEQLPPMVDASDQLRKYNMTIDFRDKHFSGLFLVKQTGENTYRTLFSTHFGLSIFDFELTPDTFIIHHCIEPLQKKKLLKLLQYDFSVLLGLNLAQDNPSILYKNPEKPGTNLVFRLTNKSAKGYYLTNYTMSHVQQIETGKGLSKTIFQQLPKPTDNSVGTIQIKHSVIGLTITLDLL